MGIGNLFGRGSNTKEQKGQDLFTPTEAERALILEFGTNKGVPFQDVMKQIGARIPEISEKRGKQVWGEVRDLRERNQLNSSQERRA